MYHLSEYYHGGYCADAGPEKAPSGIGGVGGDHFIVEDIFDFSNGGGGGGEEDDGGVFDAVVTGNQLAESAVVASGGNYCSSTSFGGPHFSDNLCEPYEESAELEWLSNFVEECFSNKIDIQKLHPISQTSSETTQDSSQSARPVPVTAKARSKRSRGGPGSWASRLPPVLISSSPSPSPSSTVPPPPSAPSPSEKPPRRYASATDGHKCLHCGSDKTPQWRTGPMGPKTLCNACGVRYKSGRLVPEYRPAASPTFVVSEHSNSHRKVVELRRQKEMQMQQHQQVLYWS